MAEKDVLIIGAGICGLKIAMDLCMKGYQVTILEARDRLGGRIHTLMHPGAAPLEAGAEFIHGNLPITMGLLREAGIAYSAIEGAMIRVSDENAAAGEPDELFPALEKQLKSLTEDISVYDFLHQHFGGSEHEALRKSISGFVEGYDAADIRKASTFALRDEGLGMGDDDQFRISSGYGRLVDFLAGKLAGSGVTIHLSCIAKTISWSPGNVEITTAHHEVFKSSRVIITVPLGVLTADPDAEAAITINPPVEAHLEAARRLGFGKVVKIHLLFDHPFWKEEGIGTNHPNPELRNAGFILSGESIPTWWMQHPENDALMTGWLAGPNSSRYAGVNNQEILDDGLRSLAGIYRIPVHDLAGKLVSGSVYNWVTDPFTLGGYAYRCVHGTNAIKILQQPALNTIFFAGEALYAGESAGTVEAALHSALETSDQFQPLN